MVMGWSKTSPCMEDLACLWLICGSEVRDVVEIVDRALFATCGIVHWRATMGACLIATVKQ